PLAWRYDEPQADGPRQRSGLRVARPRRVFVIVGRTAGAERYPAARGRTAATGRPAARSGPVQAVEAADRGPQRRVRPRRAGKPAKPAKLAQIVRLSETPGRPVRALRAAPLLHSASGRTPPRTCASRRRAL